MTKFLSIPLATKLPLIIMAITLATICSLALLNYTILHRSIMDETSEHFENIVAQKADQIENFLGEIQTDMISVAENPAVHSATVRFSTLWNIMEENPTKYLQKTYIDQNPHPTGEKHRLRMADDDSTYSVYHNKIHPYFRTTLEREGYYDIFLFDLEGNIIYSVTKEADFATNVVTGPFATSGLAEAFSQAVKGQSGEIFFTDFKRYGPSSNAPASFIATPIFDIKQNKIGILAYQLKEDFMTELLQNTYGMGKTGKIYLVGQDMKTRNPSQFEDEFLILEKVEESPQILAGLNNKMAFFHKTTGINGKPVAAYSASVNFLGTQWAVIAEQSFEEIMRPVIENRNQTILEIIIGSAIAILIGLLVARSVTTPIRRIGQAMESISKHDYDVELKEAQRNDEIGQIAKTLLNFRDKLSSADKAEAKREIQQQNQDHVVNALSEALQSLASGNLTNSIQTPFADEYEKLRADFNGALETLHHTIASVVENAHSIEHGSDDISRAADDLSQRTENQAATLEETAAALDEITTSVKSAAEGAREVETIVVKAKADAMASDEVVQNAVLAMSDIENSSGKISKIIGVIDDIAFQTNLLALNAGVEAARAGDAGRGFAVVASEVRALALRSSEAAKEIKALISDSSQQVESGAQLVGKAGTALQNIVDQVTHISSLVSRIAVGAAEQSTGLGEINLGVIQLDQVTQQNAVMVEQATVSSHSLNQKATELSGLVTNFKINDIENDNVIKIDATQKKERSEPPKRDAITSAEKPTAAFANSGIWQDF